MAPSSQCPAGSDRRFGPRVDVQCRSFDFSLAFEDLIFGNIPSALFILALLPRVRQLLRASVKVESTKLLTAKLVTLSALFVLYLVFAVFRAARVALATPFSLSSDALNVIAALAAIFLSYLEDQRSVNPSSLLVLYLSAESILSLPRLRSLWILSSAATCTIVWTFVVILNFAALILESLRKVGFLKASEKNVTTEEICGFWGRSFYIWILPLFKQGYSTVLTLDNMGQIDQELQGKFAHERLELVWRSDRSQKRAMLKSTFRAYLWPFLSAVLPRLCLTGFTFSQPFLITATVTYFEMPDTFERKYYGRALIGAFLLAYLGMAVSTAIYWRQTFRFVTLSRAGLISMIYSQTTRVKAVELRDTAAITLMSTDVERIVSSLKSAHEIWASVLDMIVAIYLLERQLFVACIVPVVLALVCVFAMSRISVTSKVSQKAWVERVQKRISVTSSMLGDMKAVKMLGLSSTLSSIVESLRNVEIKTSHHFRKLLLWQIFWSNMPIDFTPFATFAVFTIIAAVRHDGSLLTAQAFTSLSLISLLTSPLLTFTQAVPSLAQCIGCFERIDAYCRITSFSESAAGSSFTEQDSDFETGSQANLGNPLPSSIQLSEIEPSSLPGTSLVRFTNASFSWSKGTPNVLHEITFELQPKTIKMIVGPVGSGKSTLLESILGETMPTGGCISYPLSHVAYCSQTPWITNSTIQRNIIGFGQLDETWYNYVIWATSLKDDLQQIPLGDLFVAGSNGVNLSGGQRQRVSLARAVYSKKQIILLDDIASGLDTNTVQRIAARLFGADGYFRKSGRTVILATHTRSLLNYADAVIILENGRIVGEAPPSRTLLTKAIVKDLVPSHNGTFSDGSDSASSKSEEATKSAVATGIRETEPGADTDIPDFTRRDGTWSVYKYYCRMAKWKNMITFAFLAFVLAFASNFPTLWVQWWSDANTKAPNSHLGMYLGVYAFISFLSLITIIAACWVLFINIIENTALGLHADLLKSAIKAPFSFYKATDTGKTTNRFSQDMDLIDMRLPILALNVGEAIGSCAVKLIILCVVAKYLAATVPLIGFAVFVVQTCYLRTSRQVRLLDIEAKAPLFTHFMETVSGIVTIRALGWETDFEDRAFYFLNESQKPVYMLYCIQQWLTLVLDLIVGAMAVILVAITTSLKDSFSAGSVGVALNMVLTFNSTLTRLVNMWTMLEMSIGAVARIQSFVQDTPSEDRVNALEAVPKTWPDRGKVEFMEITARSSPESSAILSRISLSIQPGEKFAICGPSGSGKTSLILALLQMIDLQQGNIIVDGMDLAKMQCDDVRAAMNVIPQEPFFMPGSVRFNLDPRNIVHDADSFKQALEKARLWEKVTEKGGIEADLEAADWSVGQRQLLALARALLNKSMILVLDEATSSVDHETEAIMQDVIDKEFAQQTVIAVVHRFSFIHCFDRIGLLKNGVLIDCDKPSSLLSRDSEFKRLYDAMEKKG